MLLEAVETVYGNAPKKYKKWWQPLNEERKGHGYRDNILLEDYSV